MARPQLMRRRVLVPSQGIDMAGGRPGEAAQQLDDPLTRQEADCDKVEANSVPHARLR